MSKWVYCKTKRKLIPKPIKNDWEGLIEPIGCSFEDVEFQRWMAIEHEARERMINEAFNIPAWVINGERSK